MLKKTKKDNVYLPMILVILDGWGIGQPDEGNAIHLAKTPTMDGLARKFPTTDLWAHGKYVGLPKNQVGNSEAGHMNLGAGRLVEQDAVRISKSIKDGTFFKNSAFQGAIRHINKMHSRLHLMGMLSNGQSPHSDPEHLNALLKLLKDEGVSEVYLHLYTDGRDSPKYASLKLIHELEKKLGGYKIATIIGRFYAMDRKKKWSRTESAYQALILGQGRKAESAPAAITESYNRGESDEYIEPYIITDAGGDSRIKDGDSVIFFNLRSDRSRQLTKAFVQDDFNKMNPGAFKRSKKLQHLYFVAMTDFGPDLDDILTAFPSFDLKETLPMQLKSLTQLYIAETEKYAHVTYFFNGGYSGIVANEIQHVIPSPDVKSYDEIPGMSSIKLANHVIGNLSKGDKKKPLFQFTTLNLAAPDMIGHTGNLQAAIVCCEIVDKILAKIVKAYLRSNGMVIITADHGNIEKMINTKTSEIYTEHTSNRVPFIIVSKHLNKKTKLKNNGALCDVAPTILNLLGLDKPKEMKGESLL